MQQKQSKLQGEVTAQDDDQTDRYAMIDALQRVMLVYDRKAGYVPGNLRLFLRRMTHPRWGWRGVLPNAIVILKGYFVWQSHIVQPTSMELELIKGFPARKSEMVFEDDEEEAAYTWAPDPLVDGSQGWTDDVHVVQLGDEVFKVTRESFYAEPVCSRQGHNFP